MTERIIRHGLVLKIVTEDSVHGRAEHAWDGQPFDVQASAFAGQHGSFALCFDAAQNYVRPDDCPWTLELDSPVTREDGCGGWMGFTAETALEFAARSLAPDAAEPVG